MSPPADQDQLLLFLQGRVAQLRVAHEDLVERERLLRSMNYTTSADALKARIHTTLKEWQDASRKLAAHISRKQRGLQK